MKWSKRPKSLTKKEEFSPHVFPFLVGPRREVGCLLAFADWCKPLTGFCHKLNEITVEPESRVPHLLLSGCLIHSHKHTTELVKYSRTHVCAENKELGLQASLPCPEGSRKSPQDERLLLNKKMLGFLASGGEEFNLGLETRLDQSELLCNKVLLKYKGDRESFWHRHQKGTERVVPC